MTIRNLEKAFHPTSVAVFGGSQKPGSVGNVVMSNIITGGFEGEIWPVNPKYDAVHGRKCYADAGQLPSAPDLGIIVTPAQTVPGIITALAATGCRAAICLTAGLTGENGLRQQMLDAAYPHLFRIFGPNILGLILPHARLNASFSHMNANVGGIALLSQSGAMITSIIDWAADKEIGFSSLVSLGDMADVDVADCLDMLANDRHTKAILMYLESIPNPRKFITAARAASRLKPVIAIKAGRHEKAAKAAATHTGALAGMDGAVDAALERAGVLRVRYLEELFDAAEITTRFKPLQSDRLAIVTNGGGAGVLAVDQLADTKGLLADLSPDTIEALNQLLPPTWSHTNPVDIIGDAPPERYAGAVAAVANDPGVDAILVMNCPTALASASDAAKAVAALSEKGMISGKPVLACWLGEHTARDARAILQKAGIASFSTPGDAVAAHAFIAGWSRAQAALSRVPESRSEDVGGQRARVAAILATASAEKRAILTEPEAKDVLSAYGIAVPQTIIATTFDEAENAAAKLLKTHGRVVVKLYSKTVSHKSDIGGVVLNISTPVEARAAAFGIAKRYARHRNAEKPDGYSVQPMINRKMARECLVGIARDPVFGPVIVFGTGGTAVEVIRDTAMALPPLDDILGRDLVARTRIGKLLEGFRDVPAADMEALTRSLNAVSQLIVDFPEISGLDINPLLADAEGVIALDARIEIDLARSGEPGPNRDLPIRPYPADWVSSFISHNGKRFAMRPIKPVDLNLYPRFFEGVSQEDIRYRFLSPRRHFSEAMIKRLTQIDYEREMAFIALPEGVEEIAGIARIACDPSRINAEFGILVRSDLQHEGIGHALMEHLIAYSRAEGIERLEGHILSENSKMLKFIRELGFTARSSMDEPGITFATLDLTAGTG
ncbi:MAG: bifunctional acetate--CoA ligase family protein/GNAT family N-acetyltransferase [Nitratireductor sp.]